jgi:uncharacterized protein YecA (UPF0149 family)
VLEIMPKWSFFNKPTPRAVKANIGHRMAVLGSQAHGTIKRDEPKTGRNEPCRCGSGKKFKKCCIGEA